MVRLLIQCLVVIRTIGGQIYSSQPAYPVSIPVVSLQPLGDVRFQYISPVSPYTPQPTGQLLSKSGNDVTPVGFTGTLLSRRQLFTPAVELNSQPLTRTAVVTDISIPSEVQITEKDNNSDVYNTDKAKHEPDEVITTTSEATTPDIKINYEKKEPEINMTLVVNATEVSLDTRASFEGDKCPTGSIRVNGSSQCVPTD